MREKIEEIARQAGSSIMAFYLSGRFSSESKTDGSPVTEADKKAHKLIKAKLEELFDLAVLSEEDIDQSLFTHRPKSYWLVDPLDGTKEFIKRTDSFTVNIALIEDEHAIAGVVYAPALDEMYSAFDNQLYVDGKLFSPNPASTQRLRVLVSASHPSKQLSEFLNENNLHDTRRVGSSLKFCRLATGDGELYPRLAPTSQWDTAAGQAVAEAAGCRVINLENNQRLSYPASSILNPFFIVIAPGIEHELNWKSSSIG